MSEETKTGLLEAAERILLEEGVHALTVRRVGAVSGLNGTLVTYYFGTVSGLLEELCRRNLEPMLLEWRSLGAKTSPALILRQILAAWLAPLIRPSAFVAGGRSIVVLDEIASHGDDSLRAQLLEAMVDVGSRVQIALHPLLPHLDPVELRARVRFISAAALGPPPRVHSLGDVTVEGQPIDGLNYLIAFAEGALLAQGC